MEDTTEIPSQKCIFKEGSGEYACSELVEETEPWNASVWNLSSSVVPRLLNTTVSINGSELTKGDLTAEKVPQFYDWKFFRVELAWALPLHVYGFACLFFMLSFYTFFSILNLRSQLSTRPFMSTINVFVCTLGVSRATCFLVDPYYSQNVLPGFLGWILWDLGYPCILSAFGLIQLAFSQLTQMTFRPESLRKKSFLSLIIAIHFVCILASNIVAAFEEKLQIVRAVVQIIFVSWGIVLCFTFLYGGGRILTLLKTLPSSAFQSSEPVGEYKGILQLALLAQCNNIASSVITAAAAAPSSIVTPKIKIIDENDISISLGSDNIRTAETSQPRSIPEINITAASTESPRRGSSVGDEPLVRIEIEEATPDSPSEKKIIQETCSRKNSNNSVLEEGNSRRKKSLTWGDNHNSADVGQNNADITSPSTSQGCTGATLGSEISSGERRRRRSSDISRKSSSGSVCSSRKHSGSWDPTIRKGSYSSTVSLRQGSYYPSDIPSRKGSHVGEALVMTRKSSLCSEVASRRGSSNQSLTSGSTSRRGSHRSMKDETEVESLLRRPSDTGDVTLSSILNHIAYANQANASKIGVKVKESRKEQVKQVLIVTYVTAILGMSLSLLSVIGLYSHPPPHTLIPPWIWFSYESTCRLLEFLIGCAMANITRQPVNRPTQYGPGFRMKARNSIYM